MDTNNIPSPPVEEEDTNQLPPEVESSMGSTFKAMAESHRKRLTLPKSPSYSRQQVVSAFHEAFHLIGGVPRMALWAHENPGEFYKLYGRLLPSSAVKEVNHSGGIEIIARVAPSALDGVQAEYTVLPENDQSDQSDQSDL